MSDAVVIRAANLKKVYRLYAKPSYRFRDMFGMLGDKPGAYTEHAALDGVNLEIRRGEKVAIIGRNGAGKSTFLKLVTGVIESTSGTLEVSGKIHALLQIGTGFHPDFTGRENVYAYFAQLGVTGREADRRYAEVVDFAELEEYINQPVKTYSTGMAVRLMFSTSTAITPDLLVLDEVLGVGDAYFAQKSFERMREMCVRDGATLLLVTHDIYSAVKLCERVVWIDRGTVVLDGDGGTVVKAYEDSIRVQEQARIRVKKLARLLTMADSAQVAAGDHLLIELRSPGNAPQPALVYFSSIALYRADTMIASLPLGVDAFDETTQAHLQREATAWGDPVVWGGRASRPMLNYGSSFHQVAGVFMLPSNGLGQGVGSLKLRIDGGAERSCELHALGFMGARQIDLGVISVGPGWSTVEVDVDADDRVLQPRHARPEVNTSGIHGTGAIVVHDAAFVDAGGAETHLLQHGEPARLSIRYEIRDPALREHVQVVIALHKDGVQDVCRFIARDLMFDASARPEGRIQLHIPKLLLTDGNYAVTLMIAEAGYYDRPQTVFYSINPGVYACLSRLFEVVVIGSGLIGSGTVHLADGRWSLA